MTLAEYIAQQWEILREYGLIKGEGKWPAIGLYM